MDTLSRAETGVPTAAARPFTVAVPFSWFTPGIAGRSPLASARLMKPESPPAPRAPVAASRRMKRRRAPRSRSKGSVLIGRLLARGGASGRSRPTSRGRGGARAARTWSRGGSRGARRSRHGGWRGIPRRRGWPGCGRRIPASRWPHGGTPRARAGWPGAWRTRAWMRRRLWCRFLGQGSGKNTWMPCEALRRQHRADDFHRVVLDDPDVCERMLIDSLQQRTDPRRVNFDAQIVVFRVLDGDSCRRFPHSEPDFEDFRRLSGQKRPPDREIRPKTGFRSVA